MTDTQALEYLRNIIGSVPSAPEAVTEPCPVCGDVLPWCDGGLALQCETERTDREEEDY